MSAPDMFDYALHPPNEVFIESATCGSFMKNIVKGVGNFTKKDQEQEVPIPPIFLFKKIILL